MVAPATEPNVASPSVCGDPDPPPRVALIIPALNEAETIAEVVEQGSRPPIEQVVVVDNGSADETAARARAAGALVLSQPRRGYGSACQTAIAALSWADVLVFADGDGSDDLSQIDLVVGPIVGGQVDMVVGSRTRGQREAGSLGVVQELGNRLTCTLIWLFWGVRFSDLGPFRAIRRESLTRLGMCDPDFGWTIEMQVKAAQRGLRVLEIPVRYRCRRGGSSKVSGTIVGSYRAGRRILGYVLRARLQELRGRSSR